MKNKNEKLIKAKEIAQKIIDGSIDPHEGCNQIAQIGESNDYCDELLEFVHLAHLQTDHEDLGFNKENLKNDILLETEKFINKNT